jgi:signal transduction histidine kinase
VRQQQGVESSGETAAARWQALRPALEGFVHDARNPLHALMLQLEILRAAPGVPARRTDEMQAQLERLRLLLDALGDTALPGASAACRLDERVERALALLRWTLQRREVACRARLLPTEVASDDGESLEFLVGQVLWHALSRCPAGGTLEVRVRSGPGGEGLVEAEVTCAAGAAGDWRRAPFAAAAERLSGAAEVRGASARIRLPAAGRSA